MGDWRVGDLALCVRGGRKLDNVPGLIGYDENGADYELVSGRIYRVDRVDLRLGFTGLHFEGYDWSWIASRFRKVTPPAADEWDRETIALMNGVRVGEPADRGLVSQGGGR